MQNRSNFRETFKIENNQKIYDPTKCFQYLENQGKSIYNPNFKIHQNDIPTIYKLLVYAIQDQNTASKIGIDIKKGILLSGPIGCGKTSLMHLLKPYLHPKNDFKIKTCREISFEFAKSGYEALLPYTQKSNNQIRLPGFCFDDLGTEKQIKHFGNDCNVMAEILITRYEQFIENGTITHLTTNLSASELENFYGNRLRSRMRSMFNLISFDRNSIDKR